MNKIISEIKNEFSKTELFLVDFIAFPNIITMDMLIWCFKENTENKINSILQKFILRGIIVLNNSNQNNIFYIMHDLFRKEIKSEVEISDYKEICNILINYYTYYLKNSNNLFFKEKFFFDKLYYQLVIGDIKDWRCTYQSAMDNGDSFECSNLLKIFQDATHEIIIEKENSIDWYNYYFLLNQYLEKNNEINFEKEYDYPKNIDNELYVYWHNFIALYYNRKGNYSKALLLLTEALNKTNNNIEKYAIQYNICIVRINLQQYEQANEQFKIIEQINPYDSSYLYESIKFNYLNAVIERNLFHLDLSLNKLQDVLDLTSLYQEHLISNDSTLFDQKVPSPVYISLDRDIYNYIGDISQIQGKFADAINNYKLALKSKNIYEDIIGMAWAYNDLGKMYYLIGNSKEAETNLKLSKKYFSKSNNVRLEAYPLKELSFVYQYNGKLEQSISLIKKSITLFGEAGKNNDIIDAINTLGRLYQSRGLLKVSEKIFLFCYNYFESNHLSKNIYGWILNNLARNYLYSNNFDSALLYFQKSLEVFNSIGDKRGHAYVINNMAETFVKLGCFNTAQKLFEDSYEEKLSMGDNHGLCYSLREFAEIFIKQSELKSAKIKLDMAKKYCEKGNYLMLLGDILLSYGNYYLVIDNEDMALECYENALINYNSQNFYSRAINCISKIENLKILSLLEREEYKIKKERLIESINKEEKKIDNQITKLLSYILNL